MATTTPTRPPVFNLPNQLTASRFFLAIVLFVLIEVQEWRACLGVFVLASFTDWLDGYLARKQGLVSTLGRNLDPLVDKVLVCGAYIFLLPYGNDKWLWPWMVTVVVARELVITGLRGFMEMHGAKFGADWLGKIKMVLQCAALIAIFVALDAKAHEISPRDWIERTRDVCIYAMLATTLLSGLQYLWRAVALLRSENYTP
ncbi:MAG: CDP-diacylglycerol--glycerol-3-phosphate 3-phosphatidyltransferase [Planctomycetes bacterium]|nr:CDP-diacylglycerol--glycerol-3-phosphate 3-phosphatidyltransferase [Planctomycetota bacterium]